VDSRPGLPFGDRIGGGEGGRQLDKTRLRMAVQVESPGLIPWRKRVPSISRRSCSRNLGSLVQRSIRLLSVSLLMTALLRFSEFQDHPLGEFDADPNLMIL
jgi:hypothetical protein